MKYLWLTIRHKWFVFIYGLKVGCPIWRLITHDISKLSWKEYPHYNRQFFGDKSDQVGFQMAWLHHQHVNDHHWEFWIPPTRHDRGTPRGEDCEPLPMSLPAVQEMVSDWMGASHVYGRKAVDINNWPWLDQQWPVISRRMHPETRTLVMRILFDNGRKHLWP
jgi:hypothetical protein